MKRIRILLFIVAISFALPATFAQNTSTQGKEFWLSFMQNGFKDHVYGGWVTTQILISAKRDCSGTVNNPLTGWSEDFSVRANSITTVEVPEEQGYHNSNDYESVCAHGIHILSNDTISVYCTNIAYVSFDASFVLPIESLGDDYIIQTYDQSISEFASDYAIDNETSAFLIVATEDNTEIDITPSCATLSGRPAGQTFSISLNAGQTYHVRSTRTGNHRDLSGTRVTASDCKRIAVFNGNTLTSVPTDQENGYDHVFEQAMPLRSWGKQFVVTTSLDRNRDFIKITSSANDNIILRDGTPLTTLQYGESYIFPINEDEGSCFLQADYPCAVYLFNSSSYDQNPYFGGLGDPSMVWIAPIEQRINEVTFTTFNNNSINITRHSVNIIVKSEDIANVYLDNEQISPMLFQTVSENTEYSFTRRNITDAVHHITCENGFNAHIYGFGDAKGYAYLVGSNTIDLSTNLIVNNENLQANDTYTYCIEQPLTFNAEVNYQNYDLIWDFGDGTTSSQNPVNHTYTDKRIYNAKLIVDSEASGCTSATSDTIHFFIDLTQQYVTESDEICSGESYSGYGFDNVFISNDTILARLQDNPIHSNCQDSLLVYITARQKYYVPIYDSRCWQEGGGFYNEHGFSFQYNDPGTYEYTNELQTFQGCDSIVTLHLTIDNVKHSEFDTTLCNPYEWDGIEYNTSGDYDHIYTSIDGCDSIVTCHLNISGNVEGTTETISECDSYEWYGNSYSETGIYSKVLSTPLGCDSIVYLDLFIDLSPNPTSIFPVDTSNIAPHWVISATEFQINTYDFHLWDNNSLCHWDTVVWDFEPDVSWIIEPYGGQGRKCKIYVTNFIEDTVWLQAHVYNHCNPIQGSTQRYWLISSFYGLDEQVQESVISISPNPNHGQMSICFGDVEGHIETTVYDMRGKDIDHFELVAIPNSRHSYTIKGGSDGIYLFVFNYNGHVFTKKVFISD